MEDDSYPMTLGDWMITLLILAIPLVNIIMYLVWAFGSGNISRKTYCQACLLWVVIIGGIMLVISGVGMITGSLATPPN